MCGNTTAVGLGQRTVYFRGPGVGGGYYSSVKKAIVRLVALSRVVHTVGSQPYKVLIWS